MDFVVIEIFYLLWFSLTLGTSGDIVQDFPKNQAVLDETTNVAITCFCSGNPDTIKWSFTPVGGKEKIIKNGASGITDNDAFEGTPSTDGSKSFTLTVKTASSSTAGTYTCDEHTKRSVLLIVIEKVASCDRFPRDTSQLRCDSTLQLSCAVSYTADATLVSNPLQWSRDTPSDDDPERTWAPKEEDVKKDASASESITTATSRLNVTWPKEGVIPTYTCTATFNLFASAPTNMARQAPLNTTSCLPFTSPSDVPCRNSDGSLRTGGPSDKSETDDSSVRSAETSNLAIRVLGVAGVLLLAQMF